MRIENGSKFLVLHSDAGTGPARLEIVSSFAAALDRWTPGSRLSPIWSVEGFSLDLSPAFTEKQSIVFLGPVQPARIGDQILALREPGAAELWLTAGCFNLLARAKLKDGKAESLDQLTDWAKGQSIPYERWTVENGEIGEVQNWTNGAARAAEHLKALSRLSKVNVEPALRPTLQEYLALQASTLTRSAAMAPDLFEDYAAVGQTVELMMAARADGKLTTIDFHSRLVSLNAALSRASSQTFSGTPPILATECHFWIHSLLGTGAANIALARMSAWVQRVLGEERIPERIRALDDLRDKPPKLDRLLTDNTLLNQDLLHAATIDPTTLGPVYPLVTYFSGRDGFSSHLQTLSAPISTLSECNSYRSSLMTVTHEISHVLVHGVLPKFYPDVLDPALITHFKAMLQRNYQPATYLDAGRKLMLEGLISLEQSMRKEDIHIDVLEGEIEEILMTWRLEAQETLVHTFDFMYFYAGKPDFYIESIWNSWSAIPGISDRIPGYVMRSLCAISANLLKEPHEQRLPSAIKWVREALERLKTSGGLMSNYVDQALTYLDQIKNTPDLMRRLKQEYTGRLYLVRLARLFLFSADLAAKLYDDPHARSKGKPSGGKTALAYDLGAIGNPITFLLATLKPNPDPAESLWVLHTLAFDLRNSSLGSPHAGS